MQPTAAPVIQAPSQPTTALGAGLIAGNQITSAIPNIEVLASDLGQIKTGYKTSEFWVTVVTVATTLAAGLLPANSPVVKAVSAVSAGVMAIFYLIGRVQLKKHATTAKASVVTAPGR